MTMARTKNPGPGAAHSAADTATDPRLAPRSPAAGDSPAAAILAALSAEPGGAAVAVIAGHAGISTAAARQTLLAHEKTGTATRVKAGRPGLADRWKPAAATAVPADDDSLADAPGAGSTAAEPADAGQSDPAAAAGGTAQVGEADAGTEQEPDPEVTTEAAGNVLAIAQAADEAGRALAAGDLPAALAALDAARDQAVCGRRVIKAAASGRRAPATRPGALRDLVEEHLRKFPDATFTPHQVGKVLTRSAGAVANALDKLVSLGIAELVSDKPRSYRLIPAAPHPALTPQAAAPVAARRPRPAPHNAARVGERGRDGGSACLGRAPSGARRGARLEHPFPPESAVPYGAAPHIWPKWTRRHRRRQAMWSDWGRVRVCVRLHRLWEGRQYQG
jgi:hypothetical protein